MENVNSKPRLNGLTQESCCIKRNGVRVCLCALEPEGAWDFESIKFIVVVLAPIAKFPDALSHLFHPVTKMFDICDKHPPVRMEDALVANMMMYLDLSVICI